MMNLATSSSSYDSAETYAGCITSVSATPSTFGYYKPMSTDFVDVFYKNVERWRLETGHLSAISDVVSSESFKAIVNMGVKVVPNILHELQERPSFLFLALREITGENPVPESARGRVREMIAAWLAWGERSKTDAC